MEQSTLVSDSFSDCNSLCKVVYITTVQGKLCVATQSDFLYRKGNNIKILKTGTPEISTKTVKKITQLGFSKQYCI